MHWLGCWRCSVLFKVAFDCQVIMNVEQAKDVARWWVIEQASRTPRFCGAFYAGSVNWLPVESTFPSTSDVDVRVVLSGPNLPSKLGIIVYRGVLLDVSYVPIDQFQSPDL